MARAAQCSADPLWQQDWVESAGEKTIARRSQNLEKKAAKLYCSWFCPFAQRAWIALEEKGVDYGWVEINPYEVDPGQPGGYTKRALPLEAKGKLYPGFLEASPRGLVPALDHAGSKVWESLQLVEYIDEAFDGGVRLLPLDPLARALVRIWAAHCDAFIQKPYYTMLMEQDPAAQSRAREAMFDGCRALARAMAPLAEGPFFLGSAFSSLDIALAPFWQRYLWVGGHYRDFHFPAGRDDADFARLHAWWEGVRQRPSVAGTLVCRERLIASYSDYARNKGTSEYARSLQTGLKSKTAASDGAGPVGVGCGGCATALGQRTALGLAGGSFALGAAVGAAAAGMLLRARWRA